METIIFIGIQATGKSTFFQRRFADTHVRVNLDMLKTRRKEEKLVDACIAMRQKFVVDNTNPTAWDRARYIPKANAAGFEISCYYFESNIEEALERNSKRIREKPVPGWAIKETHERFEPPSYSEGFNMIHCVRIDESAGFIVETWKEDDL